MYRVCINACRTRLTIHRLESGAFLSTFLFPPSHKGGAIALRLYFRRWIREPRRLAPSGEEEVHHVVDRRIKNFWLSPRMFAFDALFYLLFLLLSFFSVSFGADKINNITGRGLRAIAKKRRTAVATYCPRDKNGCELRKKREEKRRAFYNISKLWSISPSVVATSEGKTNIFSLPFYTISCVLIRVTSLLQVFVL